MKDYVTVVSGLPRSGTSMLMKMLSRANIPPYVDNLRSADIDNPEGYFEYDPVKNLKEDNSWLRKCVGYSVKIVSPLLENLDPNLQYKIVFIDRNMDEILASQNKMLANRGEISNLDDEIMSAYYFTHLEAIKSWLTTLDNVETVYLNYNDIIRNPKDAATLLSKFLNFDGDIGHIASVVSPNLYRNRAK